MRELPSGRRARARLRGLDRAPPESRAPAPTLVVPDGPGLIIVEVDIPFSVGLGEEGVGQDAPRSIKGQIVPVPVPVGGVGRGRVSGCWQMGFLPRVGVPSGPRSPGEVDHDVGAALVHLGEGERCDIAPHLEGLRHRLPHLFPQQLPWEPEDPGEDRGGEGGLGLAHGVASAPLAVGARSFPGCTVRGQACVMWAQCALRVRTAPHTAQAQLCVVCVPLGGREGLHWAERTQEPRGPLPDLTVGRPWTPRPALPAPQAPRPGHFRGPRSPRCNDVGHHTHLRRPLQEV